jgi:hypothetical protein
LLRYGCQRFAYSLHRSVQDAGWGRHGLGLVGRFPAIVERGKKGAGEIRTNNNKSRVG